MPDTPERTTMTNLRELTQVDERSRLLTARLQALPESHEVQRLEDEVRNRRQKLAEADRVAEDLGMTLQRLRQDAAKLRARRRDDLRGLRAETDRERRQDLQHDLSVADRRLGEVEESISREERTVAVFGDGAGTTGTGADGDEPEVPPAVSEARVALDGAGEKLDAARDTEKTVIRELHTKIDDLAGTSRFLRSQLPDDLRERYETGERENGVGAAQLAGAVCRSCFMSLDRASLSRIVNAPADALVTCPECGTLLIREDGS
ncbi:MAG: zinc ribbon domain-containing protein [Corynebacterium sp.]|uniref:zinc ribbon domain-containing protein n=1 Tax=Corynebacterium sp. TaxID=1720 RepID=UPI003F9CCB9F